MCIHSFLSPFAFRTVYQILWCCLYFAGCVSSSLSDQFPLLSAYWLALLESWISFKWGLLWVLWQLVFRESNCPCHYWHSSLHSYLLLLELWPCKSMSNLVFEELIVSHGVLSNPWCGLLALLSFYVSNTIRMCTETQLKKYNKWSRLSKCCATDL